MDNITGLYLSQILNGCNCVSCNNSYCRSSPSFKFDVSSYEKSEIIAQQLALDHKNNNRLCKHLSPLLLSPQILIRIIQFRQFSINYINGKDVTNESKYLHLAFLSSDIFSHLFLNSDDLITAENLNFNIGQIVEFTQATLKRPEVFQPFSAEFSSLVKDLTKTQDDCLHTLRGVMLLFLFGPLWSSDDSTTFFEPVINFIFSLSNTMKTIFYHNLITYYPLILIDLMTVKNYIKKDITQHPTTLPHSPLMHKYATFIQMLAEINESIPKPYSPLSFSSSEFSNNLLSNFEMDLFSRGMFSYVQTPAILTMLFKKDLLRSESLYISSHRQSAKGKLELVVLRNNLLSSTVDAISDLLANKADFHAHLIIQFQGEKGIDAGGVSREFFQLVFSQIFDPKDYYETHDQTFSSYFENTSLTTNILSSENPFFKPMKNFYWFKSHKKPSNSLLKAYEVIGALAGLALYNGIIVPARFPSCLFRKLFKKELRLCDLFEIEPEVAKSLQSLLDNLNSIEECYLTFTSPAPPELCLKNPIELIPGGSSIDVTKDNINQFIKAKIDYELNKTVAEEFNHFAIGFLQVCDTPMIQSFHPAELSIFLSGEEDVDVLELKKHAEYRKYKVDDQTVIDFWKIFENYSIDDKQKLLSFITGSSSTPIGGMVLTIEKGSDTNLLPTAHTCFNTFVLPDYQSFYRLRRSLSICLENTEGFGIV